MSTKGKVIRGGIQLVGALVSGTGDPILTLDNTTKEVGSIASIDASGFLTTTLANGFIFVGNGSNIATGVDVTGMVEITNLGVTSIVSDTILNTHINSTSAIARSKMASGTAYRILANNATGVMGENAALTANGVVGSDANGQLQIITDLPNATTINSAFIYRAGGTDVAVVDGGTNFSSYTTGDILQASAATTFAKLVAVATGNVLISGGVATVSSWGKVGLTTHISGILPIVNGGTNLSALGTALQVLRVNAGATALEYATLSASIGGSTGATDNAVLRASGTGGATLDASTVITLSDTGNFVSSSNFGVVALGDITLTSTVGGAMSVLASGVFTLGVNGNDSLVIADGTDWSVDGSVGTAGQVFTSGGAGVSPSWTTIGGVISGLTTNRIPYATSATTLGDDAGLTWDATNNAITISLIRIHGGLNGSDTGNTFIGKDAGNISVAGSISTAIGDGALQSEVGGSGNTTIGYDSLTTLNGGSNNVAVGVRALTGATTASNNIAIGYQAGENATSGSGNIIIGYDVDLPSAGGSNQLNIQNIIFGTANSAIGTTISTGQIGIGISTSLGARLHVKAENNTLALLVEDDAGNYIFAAGEAGGARVMGCFGATPVVQQAGLTTFTHTAPGTPDYAIQDLVDTGGFGFVTPDEGNTVLSIIKAMHDAMKNYGLLT